MQRGCIDDHAVVEVWFIGQPRYTQEFLPEIMKLSEEGPCLLSAIPQLGRLAT
jgi:hypothetical protein